MHSHWFGQICLRLVPIACFLFAWNSGIAGFDCALPDTTVDASIVCPDSRPTILDEPSGTINSADITVEEDSVSPIIIIPPPFELSGLWFNDTTAEAKAVGVELGDDPDTYQNTAAIGVSASASVRRVDVSGAISGISEAALEPMAKAQAGSFDVTIFAEDGDVVETCGAL